jgi:hypothetical protein
MGMGNPYPIPSRDSAGAADESATAWHYKEGFWKMDADGRSQFMPKKDQSDVGDEDTTTAPAEDGTDNGTRLNLDEVAIKEWIEKIQEYDEASILAFVIENPLEALAVIAHLCKMTSYYEEEYTNTGLMIAQQPEQAASQLYILTREEPSVPQI